MKNDNVVRKNAEAYWVRCTLLLLEGFNVGNFVGVLIEVNCVDRSISATNRIIHRLMD